MSILGVHSPASHLASHNALVAGPSTLIEALSRTTRNFPHAVAVCDPGSRLDYITLSTRAEAIASCLRDHGVQPGDRIAVLMAKGVNAVVALYGTLMARAVYVPVDPTAPGPRIATIFRNCEPTAVITVSAFHRRLSSIIPECPSVGLLLGCNELPSTSAKNLSWQDALAWKFNADRAVVASTDLAYILYTSGSTGVPKGIAHTHRSAVAFARWAATEYNLSSADRICNHASFHFDLSTFDLYASMYVGASVFIVPAHLIAFPFELTNTLRDEAITIWYSVPLALVELMNRGGLSQKNLPHLRWILFAGEAFPARLLCELAAAVPHAQLCNLFGPTETNVCTFHHVERPIDPVHSTPIGKPLPIDEILIVDNNKVPIDDCAPGELLVRGQTVMDGYWGRGDLNEHAFTRITDEPNPWYRTGDRVKRDEQGVLHYLGRCDQQVKLRGYRVELGEIEHVLQLHAHVRFAVAYLSEVEGLVELHAAVVLERDIEQDSKVVEEIGSVCAANLPSYCVPKRIEVRSAFPLTSTGKLNRRALAAGTSALGVEAHCVESGATGA